MRVSTGMSLLQTTHRILLGVTGVDLRRTWRAARNVPHFLHTVREYQAGQRESGFPLDVRRLYPILDEFESEAGTASGDYFHQDLWAARKVFARQPTRHVDIGSRIDGFVSHVLVFMPVEVVDIRPLQSAVAGLRFVQANAAHLDGFDEGSLDSMSSLHAVEHFGLGRYGDPVDPNACFTAMRNMARVLRPEGRLYFSVPIGRERVEFNAHRFFAPSSVLGAFERLRLVSFSAVDSDGAFHADCDPLEFASASQACGLFEFTKDVDK